MEKTKVKTEREYYEEKCPNCGRLIRGTSKSQFKYNFKLHKEACGKNAISKRK